MAILGFLGKKSRERTRVGRISKQKGSVESLIEVLARGLRQEAAIVASGKIGAKCTLTIFPTPNSWNCGSITALMKPVLVEIKIGTF